jgi:hypothetical protein
MALREARFNPRSNVTGWEPVVALTPNCDAIGPTISQTTLSNCSYPESTVYSIRAEATLRLAGSQGH